MAKIQLEIPKPCHENWDKMDAAEKGKFCQSCQKQVIDFTNMSDREVAQFFKKPSTGSVCGRFMQDQLNREFEIPNKRIPWLRYFFQIAIPAFLASQKASAQIGKVTRGEVKQITCSRPITGDTVVLPEVVVTANGVYKKPMTLGQTFTVQPRIRYVLEMQQITGKVVNEKGEPLPGISIKIKGARIGTFTGPDGMYKLEIDNPPNGMIIQALGLGLETTEVSLSGKSSTVNIVMKQAMMGAVITTGFVIRKKSKAKTIPLIPQRIMDTAFKFFKVFPNPVSAGSELTIEWKQQVPGYYVLQLLNQSGQAVHQREVWIDAEAKWLNLDIPSVSSGTYFLHVVNKQSGKGNTEKIIIR